MSFCNGCTACCIGDKVQLFPGDDPENWETVQEGDKHYLKQGVDGNCIYLLDHGCSIHGRQPVACRSFNCATYFKSKTRPQRKELIKAQPRFKAIFDAGRARLQGD